MAKLTKKELLNLSRLHHEISVMLLREANKGEDEGINSEVIGVYQEIGKIYSLDKSTEEVSKIMQKIRNEDFKEEIIGAFLKELGIPTNIKGYCYLKDVIKLTLSDRSMLKQITNKLYPEVAKINETTSSRTERDIRHAIELAWRRNSPEVVEKYFGNTILKSKGKPTNSEFISTVTDYISLRISEN